MSKNPGCLGHTGDYITQLCSDYNKPLYTRILINSEFGRKHLGLVATHFLGINSLEGVPLKKDVHGPS